jgi:DNA (cytosine-5)-methyltransferase 1
MVSNYGTGGDASKRGRRDWDEPAFTVTGKINRNRIVARDGRELDRLSHSEAGRLQGFPADYPWSGKDIPQQIGNAAPVQLMTSVLLAAQGF